MQYMHVSDVILLLGLLEKCIRTISVKEIAQFRDGVLFRKTFYSMRISFAFYLFAFHRNVRRIVKFFNEIIESTDAII